MANYDPSADVCPHCGSKGKCVPFGHYGRNVLDYDRIQKKVVCNCISVTRVRCESCSTDEHSVTHAVLADAIIPYSPYSLLFILAVLYERLCLGRKLKDVCAKFQISPVQFYRWERLLRMHMREWLGILEAMEQAPNKFLRNLIETENYSAAFAEAFLRKTTFSFLQNHINPANCRYPIFAPP